jgi:hypothetical protein
VPRSHGGNWVRSNNVTASDVASSLLLVLGDAHSILNARVAYTLKLVGVDDFYFLGLSELLPRSTPALSRIVGTKLVSFGRISHLQLV